MKQKFYRKTGFSGVFLALTLSLILVLTLASLCIVFAEQREPTVLFDGLDYPIGVAVDKRGNIYFTEYGTPGEGNLKVMFPDGTVKTIVSGLTTPTGVVVDAEGNIYFAESAKGTIKKVSPDFSKVEVLVKNLTTPWSLALDKTGEILYVSSKSVNGTIIKINLKTGDRTVVLEELKVPYGVCVDNLGNIYFTEFLAGRLEMLPAGVEKPVILLENLTYPYAVVVDKVGNIYFSEKVGTIKKVGKGKSEPVLLADGLGRVYGLALDEQGDTLYFTVFGKPLARGTGSLNKLTLREIPPTTSSPTAKLEEKVKDLEKKLSLTLDEVKALKSKVENLTFQTTVLCYGFIGVLAVFIVTFILLFKKGGVKKVKR